MHTALLVIILLFIIICNFLHYLLSLCKALVKAKRYWCTFSIKIANYEFKKVHIKNCTCYYFDYIIKLKDFDIDNVLIDEKSHENISIYDISYKTLIGSKSLRIRFDKINEFIRIYDGTIYLTLFGSEKYDAIYDRIDILYV